MHISPVHHFRKNAADFSSLQDIISTLMEYSEYLVGAVGEINSNGNSTPTHGMTLHLVADRDADDWTNGMMTEAVDEIIGAALDVAVLLNTAAKAEVADKLQTLSDSAHTSHEDAARLEKLLAALHVPHKVNIQRNLYAAEATVRLSDPSFPKATQAEALRTIARGEKAKAKVLTQI